MNGEGARYRAERLERDRIDTLDFEPSRRDQPGLVVRAQIVRVQIRIDLRNQLQETSRVMTRPRTISICSSAKAVTSLFDHLFGNRGRFQEDGR